MKENLLTRIQAAHEKRFGNKACVLAFAPGRIEVLGNHTDYNEGFVLSAAIDSGIIAALSTNSSTTCLLQSLDINEEALLPLPVRSPLEGPLWANYVAGVMAGLNQFGLEEVSGGFNMTVGGDIPLSAGLSSSAALEVSSALAFCAAAGIELPALEIAKICQSAEHEFVGTKCGLLDQLSSLFGESGSLIFSDFRSVEVKTVPVGLDICFLMINTRVKHNLVDSEYNQRRASCERATAFFAEKLRRPVKSLRDVSEDDLNRLSDEMDQIIAMRAAHVIGENRRVLEGRKLLASGDMRGFGKLMFESHESSRVNFENSCRELDFIVEAASGMKNVLGARLSGGGFGGSAVLLVRRLDAEEIAAEMRSRYDSAFNLPSEIRVVEPSSGARVIYSSFRS